MFDRLHFFAIVDLPLAVGTLLGFILHFNAWSRAKTADTTVDLSARLAVARIRVAFLFAAIVCLCWLTDFAFWAVFAILLGIGFVIAIPIGLDVTGGYFLLLYAAYAIREWAFGFPQLILHPACETSKNVQNDEPKQEMTGQQGTAVSPLRPCGEAEFDGQAASVVSETGEFLDVGTAVTITGKRNGLFCVRSKES